ACVSRRTPGAGASAPRPGASRATRGPGSAPASRAGLRVSDCGLHGSGSRRLPEIPRPVREPPPDGQLAETPAHHVDRVTIDLELALDHQERRELHDLAVALV